MTNEINLRTNKSEYNAGDDIYGVVYLRINTPTRGRGVRIRFKGYEKFNYEDKRNRENEPPVCYSDHRDYVSLDEILHQSDGPLSMCITYYPFKIKLPMEIPGTFHARHESEELGERWDARVEYILEAEVIDASKALATNQKVSVRQSLQRELKAKDAPAAILAKYEDSSFFGLFTSAIDVTARFKLDYVKNMESLCSHPMISVLTIITILQPRPESCRYLGQPLAYHTFHSTRFLIFFTRNVHVTARDHMFLDQNPENVQKIKRQELLPPKMLHDHIHRTGENARLRVIITNNSNVIVQSIKLQLRRSIYLTCPQMTLGVQVQENVGHEQSIDMVRFPKGFDNMQIPLKDANNRPVYPSVRGQHINCEYQILLTVYLGNGEKFELIVPISVIVVEKNKQWDTWIQPGWITNDSSNVQSIEDSVLRVPENILSSEPFSSLPGFQPL